ncbi:Uu.00g076000.m01.CDS01 [Anthostomella pinea]|uniref:Uu.00g076000.m01.CDS01 n=1 Tax=Anthostomella pinea TaxID=933095 RepID=A0AAI8YP86_9PEZI|nr:Uu.00g076000.m01.CDS01 [Anthostomella pinea]
MAFLEPLLSLLSGFFTYSPVSEPVSDIIEIVKMCTCEAFKFRSCPYGHDKFENESICLATRLGWKECPYQVITNGSKERSKGWPVIDGICSVCFPEEAAAEEKEKKAAAEAEKKAQLKAAEGQVADLASTLDQFAAELS